MVKNLLEMQETQVQFPSLEDLLQKGMATHSSIFSPSPQKSGSKKYFYFPGGSDGKASTYNVGENLVYEYLLDIPGWAQQLFFFFKCSSRT